jgi:pimeloyl-ACP methyl ester carboxylesterase
MQPTSLRSLQLKAILATVLSVTIGGAPMSAETPRERTLEEIKEESIARAERGGYPLIGLDPADVREAFRSITTLDKDEWAAAWIAIGDRYCARAQQAASHNPAEAGGNYLRAWRIYSFGRWPVPSSPGKQRAYAKALEAFLAAAKTLDPPLEVVRIPFEAAEIIAYMRLPKTNDPVPIVLAISGLDSRKENLVESFGAILAHNIGVIAVDGPGTGEAPIKVSETADRMFSRLIDYLVTRPEIDKRRIIVHGVSFGGYWSAKLAITERARIKAASAQSPAVHEAFQAAFVEKKLLGNREYLFDYAPALISAVDGATSVEDLKTVFPRLSLWSQGLLGRPSAPMLIIGGARDTQVPIADAYLLLASGDAPKEAWINPQGGHLGRQPTLWPDPVIFNTVLIPWIVRATKDPAI